jgi:predicted Ser/Thr protein kinase
MSTPGLTLRHASTDTGLSTRISHPRRLWIARFLWVLLALLNLSVFAAALINSSTVFRWGTPLRFYDYLQNDTGDFVVVAPEEQTAQVVHAGDILVAVNGTALSGQMSRLDVYNLMIGEIGSPITLTVRSDVERLHDVTIPRLSAVYSIAGGLNLGLSRDFAATTVQALDILVFLASVVVAGLIFWRRSDDWMALWAAWGIMTFAITESQITLPFQAATAPPVLRLSYVSFVGIAYLMMAVFVLLFPNGRFVPRWTVLVAGANALWALLVYSGLTEIPFLLSILVQFGFVLSFAAIFGYRYRRVFTPLQRQQVKWFLFGIIIALLGSVSVGLGRSIIELLGQPNLANRYDFIAVVVSAFARLFLPLTMAFALLRYRLWDVDLVINRSLVYGAVTLVLAAIFLGGGFLLVTILGQGNTTIAFAVSILAAALLFNPIRQGVQHFIDRRFYHFRFDLDQLKAAQKDPAIKNPGALTGRTLGTYHVLGLIGKGGMGEVYQGQGEGRMVALKILPDELAQQEEFRKRFEREALALAAFDHPNIVKTFGAGLSEGVYYIALEYVDGQELAAIIKQRGAIPLDEVRPFVHNFAEALDYAHRHKLVHRDLKPSNIMIRLKSDGVTREAVLMDFGVAKIQDAQTNLTGTGAIGTIDYMAPEQIMAAGAVDHRADIYALGVVLYEMLTGEHPFKGSPGQILFAHLQQPAPDPRTVRGDILVPVADAIMKAMAKAPDKRFQSAGEFAAVVIAASP